MAEFYQLRYGQRVRVIEGEQTGTEGYISMGSRFGDVGINVEPKLGYNIRVQPSALEVLVREPNTHLRDPLFEQGMDIFWQVRLMMCRNDPDEVLANQQYFEQEEIRLAMTVRRTREERREAP